MPDTDGDPSGVIMDRIHYLFEKYAAVLCRAGGGPISKSPKTYRKTTDEMRVRIRELHASNPELNNYQMSLRLGGILPAAVGRVIGRAK